MLRFWNLLVFTLIIFFDQLTKLIAASSLIPSRPVPVIPGLFNFTLVYNPGAAFGLFSALPDAYRRFTLLVVSGLALVVVFRFIVKEARDDRVAQAALAGILAGAIGNIIDRVRFDAVVDFLDFYVGKYHWPAFNVADSAISLGVCILVLRLFLAGRKEEAEQQSVQGG